MQLDKFSPQDMFNRNSDQSSSGLKIDDESYSDKESRKKEREKHLEELSMIKRPSYLNRKSMQEIKVTNSPLITDH
jgi:hypothetical protein